MKPTQSNSMAIVTGVETGFFFPKSLKVKPVGRSPNFKTQVEHVRKYMVGDENGDSLGGIYSLGMDSFGHSFQDLCLYITGHLSFHILTKLSSRVH